MREQLTIYDSLPAELPLGWLNAELAENIKGDRVDFKDLAELIDSKVIEELPRQNGVSYRVVLVKIYLRDSDEVYEWRNDKAEVVGTCDRVGMSDDRRKGKTNIWVSESFCMDSYKYQTRFYRIKEQP